MPKVRQLQQRDWDQLLMLAGGYLPLTGGDLREAMARAIAAHADLIRAVREEGITTHVPRGKVTLFVPQEGGIALAFESAKGKSPGASEGVRVGVRPDIGDLALKVVEHAGYVQREEEETGPIEGDWPEVG